MNASPLLLYLIVVVSGGSVLSLEILGTRILGPYFGVSLYLWSAQITVALAALSLGYLAGGHWADRGASFRRLCLIPGAAGLMIVAIPWVQPHVVALTAGWELRASILGASVLLFFAPLMVLGAVTPYAIRLLLPDVARAGRVTGRIFALSTLASVASALLTGFFLIPNLGVHLLTSLLGAGLLLTAAVAWWLGPKGRGGPIPPLLLLATGVAAGSLSPSERPDPDAGLLDVRQSAYAEIRVYDNEEGRHLLIDRGIHSRIDTATGRSTIPYAALMEMPMRYFPAPGRMLLLGLGGGALARSYAAAGWRVDAVEIDPEVVRTAREWFGLDRAGAEVFEMDARRYLARTDRRYDVVLVDAYGSSSIPFHLVTAEAFGLAKAVLRPGGIVAVNVICLGWRDPLVSDIAATLRAPFSRVLALPMAEPPDRLGNLILLAADRDLEGIPEPERNVEFDPGWRYGHGYALTHAWDNRFVPDAAGAVILTDDLNRVDVVSARTMLAARTELLLYYDRLNLRW